MGTLMEENRNPTETDCIKAERDSKNIFYSKYKASCLSCR